MGPFLNQSTFNKLSKGLLDDNTYKISRNFACSGPDKHQFKNCWGVPYLSQGHYFNNFVEVHWQMLYIKYLELEVSDKNICLCFPSISL